MGILDVCILESPGGFWGKRELKGELKGELKRELKGENTSKQSSKQALSRPYAL